jgi:hypothetical protein
MRLYLLAAFALVPISVTTHAASLNGDTVDIMYLYPNTSTISIDDGARIVPISTQTFTTYPNSTQTEQVTVNISGSQIVITDDYGELPFLPGGFNGFEISILSGETLSSVTVDPSSSSAFSAGAVLTNSPTNIFLNLAGTCDACTGPETITLDVDANPAPAPEPSSFVLLGTGLLGFAGMAKRRFI